MTIKVLHFWFVQVSLLLPCGTWTKHPALSLVEEVRMYNYNARSANQNQKNLYSFSEALLHIAHISQSINSHFRRYLTRLQMAQFVIFFAHAMQPLFIECDYPKVPLVMIMMIMTTKMIMIWQDSSTNFFQIYCWIILGHGVLYFCLFSNFYSKSYLSKNRCALLPFLS